MSEPLPKPVFKHYNEFYFTDGGPILRTTDGILYNVYRGPLAKKSGFLPRLLFFLMQLTRRELDALFDFIFNFKPWTTDLPSLTSLCAILKLSHFFDIETGTDYAIHHLTAHPHRTHAPSMSLWPPPIDKITQDDEQLIGRVAYRLLVKPHAK
ncbi:hypothetical protein B0H14DRAFT_2700529, partial [Mycena olivaceomarginata]